MQYKRNCYTLVPILLICNLEFKKSSSNKVYRGHHSPLPDVMRSHSTDETLEATLDQYTRISSRVVQRCKPHHDGRN